MKKRLLATVLIATLLAIGLGVGSAVANPGVTVYDGDKPGWEAAVLSYATEDFTDATLNPGISVITDNGYVTGGVWWDRLVTPGYGQTTTTWVFDNPIHAFGGTWNPGVPGGPGASIAVYINGSWQYVGEISKDYINVFWGFVSDVPFTQVRLQSGSSPGAWCETYEMDDMVYSSHLKASIDIKPGSFPNSINLKSNGVIPVAVLGSPTFDVTQIDATTLVFCPGLGAAAPAHDPPGHLEDVNGDGYLDLVSHYRTQDTGINPGQQGACLTFMTYAGAAYGGCDSIRTVPSK